MHRIMRTELHRSRNQNHSRSSCRTFIGKRKAHLTRRIIADETHRIYFFIRRSGSYHNFLSGQVTVFGCEELFQMTDDNVRFFHSSFAHQMARQLARARFYDMIAIRAQRLQILLGGRMSIHIQIHRRSHKHRSFRRQISGYQHIVGNAIRHFTDSGSRGRSYQHGIRPQAQIHVTVPCPVTLRKKLTDDRLPGEGG